MRYAKELLVALSAVREASLAARSLQNKIATTKAAYQKLDTTGGGHGSVSPVTAADFMVQALILSSLAKAFPNDRFIAEESSAELIAAGDATKTAVMAALSEHAPGSLENEADVLASLDLGATGVVDGWSRTRRTWVLDPIDGTKGFLRGDQFAVALALLDDGQPVIGCLGCPALGEEGSLFYASKGGGAFCGTTHGAASGAFASRDQSAVDAVHCQPTAAGRRARTNRGIRGGAFESRGGRGRGAAARMQWHAAGSDGRAGQIWNPLARRSARVYAAAAPRVR